MAEVVFGGNAGSSPAEGSGVRVPVAVERRRRQGASQQDQCCHEYFLNVFTKRVGNISLHWRPGGSSRNTYGKKT